VIDQFKDIEVYDALVEGYDPDEVRPDWWDDDDEQDWHDQFRDEPRPDSDSDSSERGATAETG